MIEVIHRPLVKTWSAKTAHHQIIVFVPVSPILTWSCSHTDTPGCASHIPSEFFLLCPFLLCKFAHHFRKCCTWPFQKGKAISLFILQIITDLRLNVRLCFNIARHKYPASFINTVLPAGNQAVLRCWGGVSLCFSNHGTCFAQMTFFHNTWISSTLSNKSYPAVVPVVSGIFGRSSVCKACARLLYLQFEGVWILQRMRVSKHKL